MPGRPGRRPFPRPGYHLERKPRYTLAIIGGAMTVGLELINAAGGYAFKSSYMAIPVYGPFVAASRTFDEIGRGACSPDWLCNLGDAIIGLYGALFVLDGLAQLAGPALVVAGLVTKHDVEVLNVPRVRIVPFAPGRGDGFGLAVAGTF